MNSPPFAAGDNGDFALYNTLGYPVITFAFRFASLVIQSIS
jgi:hypothetical protein